MDDLKVLVEAQPQQSQAAGWTGSGPDHHHSANTPHQRVEKLTNRIVKHFEGREPSLDDLLKQRKAGWNDKDTEKYYAAEAEKERNPTDADKLRLFETYVKVGEELHKKTGCMDIESQPQRKGDLLAGPACVLDLGIAPGGSASVALEANSYVCVRGVTLDASSQHGGDTLMLYRGRDNSNKDIQIKYLDITMLGGYLDLTIFGLGPSHPLASKLTYERLDIVFPEPDAYDLVFCGGSPITRTTHNKDNKHDRVQELHQSLLLTLSQLVVAVSHIRKGGTMVVLLHRPEAWVTTQLMYTISKFAKARTVKPRSDPHQRVTSSFYLVATEVKPQSDEATVALGCWKDVWRRLTVEAEGPHDYTAVELENVDLCGETVQAVLTSFGRQMAELSRSVWLEQAEGLKNAPWKKKGVVGDA